MDIFSYVLNNYFLNFSLKRNEIDISYGLNNNSTIKIIDTGATYFNDKINTEPKFVIDRWKQKEIPFLFSNQKASEIITKTSDNKIIINYDIIAASFYFLSAWQEFVSDEKDDLGRFPFEASFQNKYGTIDIPLVNYYFDILSMAINQVYNIPSGKNSFTNKPFVTFVSHDIDNCTTGWKQDAFFELKNMRPGQVIKILYNKLLGKDSWFNFSDIIEFNQARNINSSYYFITQKGMNQKYQLLNADYMFQSKKIQKIVKMIDDSGSEIGLHGSIESAFDSEKMKADVRSINRPFNGHRSHFLMYDITSFASILEENNITYDNSAYFAEHIGFRHGICFPFYLYDFKNDRMSQVLEFPLVIMDATFQQSKYMNTNTSEIVNRSKTLVSEIKKFHGIIGILWHNNYYSNSKYSGWKGALSSLLDFLEDEGCEYLNGEELLDRLNVE